MQASLLAPPFIAFWRYIHLYLHVLPICIYIQKTIDVYIDRERYRDIDIHMDVASSPPPLCWLLPLRTDPGSPERRWGILALVVPMDAEPKAENLGRTVSCPGRSLHLVD